MRKPQDHLVKMAREPAERATEEYRARCRPSSRASGRVCDLILGLAPQALC